MKEIDWCLSEGVYYKDRLQLAAIGLQLVDRIQLALESVTRKLEQDWGLDHDA